ncbi:TonB-dependent siderophore receptor, partial [Pseudomonas sp. SIMBA_041]
PQGSAGYVLQPVADGNALQLDATAINAATLVASNGQGDSGYRAVASATASKTSSALADTPRSVSVVTRQRMDDQQSQTLTEV